MTLCWRLQGLLGVLLIWTMLQQLNMRPAWQAAQFGTAPFKPSQELQLSQYGQSLSFKLKEDRFIAIKIPMPSASAVGSLPLLKIFVMHRHRIPSRSSL